jgi:hypothetical protein
MRGRKPFKEPVQMIDLHAFRKMSYLMLPKLTPHDGSLTGAAPAQQVPSPGNEGRLLQARRQNRL